MRLINLNTEHIYLYYHIKCNLFVPTQSGRSILPLHQELNEHSALYLLWCFPISLFNELLSVTVVAQSVPLSVFLLPHSASPAEAEAIKAD